MLSSAANSFRCALILTQMTCILPLGSCRGYRTALLSGIEWPRKGKKRSGRKLKRGLFVTRGRTQSPRGLRNELVFLTGGLPSYTSRGAISPLKQKKRTKKKGSGSVDTPRNGQQAMMIDPRTRSAPRSLIESRGFVSANKRVVFHVHVRRKPRTTAPRHVKRRLLEDQPRR